MDTKFEFSNFYINFQNLIILILRILRFENREHKKFQFHLLKWLSSANFKMLHVQ